MNPPRGKDWSPLHLSVGLAVMPMQVFIELALPPDSQQGKVDINEASIPN
jgi:hypothetical protein